MATETTLRSYGVDNAPAFRKYKTIRLSGRRVGHICWRVRTGSKVYVSERDSGDHRYRGQDRYYDFRFEGKGYGLSLDVFEPLFQRDITAVYIVETDTGDVYQFKFQQFVDGTPINTRPEPEGRVPAKDVQKVVPVSAAVDSWTGLNGVVFKRQKAFE